MSGNGDSERINSSELRGIIENTVRSCLEEKPGDALDRIKCLVAIGFMLLDRDLQRIAINTSPDNPGGNKKRSRAEVMSL